MELDATGFLRIGVAAFCGAAIGLERQWSGKATGPGARIGGIRTFTLLGMLAGIAGWISTVGSTGPAVVLLAGGAALVVVSYLAISGRELEGTTEVAALVTLGAGLLAGLGHLALASGTVAVATLLLIEKSWLHASIARLDDEEVRAGTRFAIMAVVILPLLPEGPYGPLGGVRPRLLWILVLFFSGMSFVGYIARRIVGAKYGYAATGLLGGLVSSTNVTFSFARESKNHPELAGPLAFGILAACTVLYLRVIVATAVLNADLVTPLLPYVAPPLVVGLALIAARWRRLKPDAKERGVAEPTSPLHLRSALQMAALFQAVLFAVHLAQERWGGSGLLALGAILGLTDMDALTVSMARAATTPALVPLAAQAVAIGIVSNNLFKAAVAALLGRGAVRLLVPLGLAAMIATMAAGLILFR